MKKCKHCGEPIMVHLNMLGIYMDQWVHVVMGDDGPEEYIFCQTTEAEPEEE